MHKAPPRYEVHSGHDLLMQEALAKHCPFRQRPRFHVHYTPTYRLLAQPGGTVVRADHQAGDPVGKLLQRQRVDHQGQAVCGHLQQVQSAVQLDCGFKLRKAPAKLLANLREDTQACIHKAIEDKLYWVCKSFYGASSWL
jgi:hypothetical protein